MIARALMLAALVGGGLVGGAMTFVAYEHNPHGAFHDDGGVHLAELAFVFAPWFVVAAAPFAVASLIALVVQRRR